MKKYNWLLLLFFLLKGIEIFAQTGMVTNNPDVNAVLDLNRTDGTNIKGLLLPNVALTSTGAATPLQLHIAGMHVWNTATTGSGATAVTPGEYYNNGAQWIRISSSGWSLGGNANTTAGTNFVGTTDNKDFVLKTANAERIRVTAGGNVGMGTASPNARIDIRPNSTSTSNPGEGYLGIGTTTVAANTAGTGAIRYNTASGGGLEFSDGIVWNRLPSTIVKTVVVAKKITPQTFYSSSGTSMIVTDWMELEDNNNAFNAATGVFVAPRTGLYAVSFCFNFAYGPIVANSSVQALIDVAADGNRVKKGVYGFPLGGTSQAGASVTFTVSLNAGETLKPMIWHELGSDKTLRVGAIGTADDGFNNLSIVEL